MAETARPFAANALPALNPNQPNQSKPAPIAAKGRLCGGDILSGYPLRRPRNSAAASAETPAVIWTTIPPAKSTTPIAPKKPPIPQTQWATG